MPSHSPLKPLGSTDSGTNWVHTTFPDGPKPIPEELMWKGCNFTSLVADPSWFQTLWIHRNHPSRQRAPAMWQQRCHNAGRAGDS